MGIPADVTVGLAVNAVASAVTDSLFQTVTGAFFPFLCGGINRGSVTGKGKAEQVNQSILYRVFKKKHLKNFVEESAGFHGSRRMLLELLKKVFDRDFFNGRSFVSLLIRLFGLILRGMGGIGKVILVREPQTSLEIVKSAGTGGIPDEEAGKDGMEMIFLEVSGPLGIGRDLELDGKKKGTEHIGRQSGCRPENRIAVLHEGVQLREVKSPEFFHDIPCRSRERGNSIRIIVTQLSQDTLLIGGMTARIKRFQ